MTALDRLIPKPALREIDCVELAVNAERAWRAVRELDLAQSTLVQTLFGIRTLPDRLKANNPQLRVRLDTSPNRPGFQILAENPPHEVVVGAIGKVWRPVIPFVHMADAAAFAAFSEHEYIKVAWALRIFPEGECTSLVEFELRVAATDETAWKKFTRYFRLIGPGSHLIRRVLLAQLQRELGTPESEQNEGTLPGDELIRVPRPTVHRGCARRVVGHGECRGHGNSVTGTGGSALNEGERPHDMRHLHHGIRE
jgi:hypothetical protein